MSYELGRRAALIKLGMAPETKRLLTHMGLGTGLGLASNIVPEEGESQLQSLAVGGLGGAALGAGTGMLHNLAANSLSDLMPTMKQRYPGGPRQMIREMPSSSTRKAPQAPKTPKTKKPPQSN